MSPRANGEDDRTPSALEIAGGRQSRIFKIPTDRLSIARPWQKCSSSSDDDIVPDPRRMMCHDFRYFKAKQTQLPVTPRLQGKILQKRQTPPPSTAPGVARSRSRQNRWYTSMGWVVASSFHEHTLVGVRWSYRHLRVLKLQ